MEHRIGEFQQEKGETSEVKLVLVGSLLWYDRERAGDTERQGGKFPGGEGGPGASAHPFLHSPFISRLPHLPVHSTLSTGCPAP